MAHDMAVREIVRNSLTQFDPAVVEAFLASVQSEDLPTHPSGRMDWPAERAVASEV
jgi:HD-GYP domain-containing protein (c-di-GMP phosphodiesterase class II)